MLKFSPRIFSDLVSCLARGRSSLGTCRHYVRAAATARERRVQKTALLRRNRRDPELERAARTGSLTVPLEEVQWEWRVHRGLEQLLTTASHFNLHQDLYGGQQFRPRGFIDVVFGEKAVHRGTILTPSEAACPPRVVSGLPRDELCTLVLSNPDGHLLDHSKELLNWMVVNIAGGEVSTGHEVVPYLQPVPPRGSGLHRYVFTLFTHSGHIDPDTPVGDTWLSQRTFSTAEFLKTHPTLQPFTFSLFQSQWDSSVHTAYMEDLVYPEPVYEVERELTPRRQREEKTRQRKANHYRIMF